MKFNAMTGIAVVEPASVVEVEVDQLWQTKPTLAGRIQRVISVSAVRIETLDVGGVTHQNLRTYPPATFLNCHEPAVDWFLKDGTKVVIGGLYSCTEYKNREVKRIDTVGLKFVDGGLYRNDEGSRLRFQNLYSVEPGVSVGQVWEFADGTRVRIVRVDGGTIVTDRGTDRAPHMFTPDYWRDKRPKLLTGHYDAKLQEVRIGDWIRDDDGVCWTIKTEAGLRNAASGVLSSKLTFADLAIDELFRWTDHPGVRRKSGTDRWYNPVDGQTWTNAEAKREVARCV